MAQSLVGKEDRLKDSCPPEETPAGTEPPPVATSCCTADKGQASLP